MVSKLVISDTFSAIWAFVIVYAYYYEYATVSFIISAWFFLNNAFIQHKMLKILWSDEYKKLGETLGKISEEKYQAKKSISNNRVMGIVLDDGRFCPADIWNNLSMEDQERVYNGASF